MAPLAFGAIFSSLDPGSFSSTPPQPSNLTLADRRIIAKLIQEGTVKKEFEHVSSHLQVVVCSIIAQDKTRMEAILTNHSDLIHSLIPQSIKPLSLLGFACLYQNLVAAESLINNPSSNLVKDATQVRDVFQILTATQGESQDEFGSNVINLILTHAKFENIPALFDDISETEVEVITETGNKLKRLKTQVTKTEALVYIVESLILDLAEKGNLLMIKMLLNHLVDRSAREARFKSNLDEIIPFPNGIPEIIADFADAGLDYGLTQAVMKSIRLQFSDPYHLHVSGLSAAIRSLMYFEQNHLSPLKLIEIAQLFLSFGASITDIGAEEEILGQISIANHYEEWFPAGFLTRLATEKPEDLEKEFIADQSRRIPFNFK